MLQHSIGKEEILHVADEIIKKLDPLLEEDRTRMSKGLKRYREGRVYNVSLEGNMLEGTVDDEDNVHSVSLNVRESSQSYCDCFQPNYCEHMIAVLFYAASTFGQVGEITKRFKEKGKPKIALSEIKTAKQLLKTQHYDEMNYESWLRYFETEYEAFLKEQKRFSYRQMYFLVNIFEEFYAKLIRKAPKISMLRELFELNAALFALQMLLQEEKSFDKDHTYSYYNPATIAERFVDEIEEQVSQLTIHAFPMAFDEVLQKTSHTVHQLFFNYDGHIFKRYYIYRHIWTELLNRPLWIKDEQQLIQQESNSLEHALASSHLLFLQKKDSEAMKLLADYSGQLSGVYLYWIDVLSDTLQWNRAKAWIVFTYKYVREYIKTEDNYYASRDLVRMFLTSYERYAAGANEQAGLELVLEELLPYSFVEFNTYLLDKKQYKGWVELQMLIGFNDLSELKEVIKEIEKENREYVLPLYHRAAMEAISLKNRQGYRLAVRYLKKLRTHYTKLKRTDEWELFITTIAASYSRLRALQEELRKGKLINDETN
ncbi:hypothetical protein [Bacillus sp. 165]|uniref:SWIM zinc finger family protein n=1 Tax=Bacillus sp. 165 TaxID=1529117 RepID=UPI001ADA4AC8|nr:hypothetical protein [Bacillus sp. 165]MBO9129981.1 hypothetical protein [Bacillus sp. 165]